jgi:hypothetical protein
MLTRIKVERSEGEGGEEGGQKERVMMNRISRD